MVGIRVEDIVGIDGDEYRVIRVLSGGWYARHLRFAEHSQFISSEDVDIAGRLGMLSVRPAPRDGVPAGTGNGETDRFFHAICDGAQLCVGQKPLPPGRVHRELCARFAGVDAVSVPSLRAFRSMVLQMGAAMEKRPAFEATAGTP